MSYGSNGHGLSSVANANESHHSHFPIFEGWYEWISSYGICVTRWRSLITAVSAAAEALGVHQSALSRRVRDFEDRVGISLFERGRDGVRPTIAGETLLRDVRRSIHTLQRTIERAGAVGRAEHGRLLIGYAGSMVSTRMLRLAYP